jgi:prepilin signal peptidase PulO-like enzyme (type II secretory pathway)
MIMLMVLILFVLGLVLGSFDNALVWRVRQRELALEGKGNKKLAKQLFKANSRSMCPNCHHLLGWRDLVPVFSYLALGGKCRYCKKHISWQYPLVELSTAILFIVSFIFWPVSLVGSQWFVFGLWLVILTGLVALAVYDLKWMILPSIVIVILCIIATLMTTINIINGGHIAKSIINLTGSIAISAGIFYVIFKASKGKWIGGGDINLGVLIGLIVATPAKAMLVIFLASLGGSLIALVLMALGRFSRKSVIPFGPFLIGATIIVLLFGQFIIDWYVKSFLAV